MPRIRTTVATLTFVYSPLSTEFLGYGGEPTSLLYALAPLAARLKEPGLKGLSLSDLSVVTFNSGADRTFAAFLSELEATQPRLVGISTMSPSSPNARRIARAAKHGSSRTITVFGGPHEDEMIEYQQLTRAEQMTQSSALTFPTVADISVSGDGEYALLFLVETLAVHPELDAAGFKSLLESLCSSIRELPGIGEISFRNAQGKAVHLPLSSRPLDLNALPPLPRHLIDDQSARRFSIFRKHGTNVKTAQIITRRGCPWACSFCTEGTDRNERSLESVRHEIESARDLGYEAIFFDDSTFTDTVRTSNQRGKEGARRRAFLSRLLAYLQKEGWEWGCETRIDQIDKETLIALKEAGCTYIYFGIESVNDRLLRDMHKGQSKDRVTETLDCIDEVGMRIGLSLMFCAPNLATQRTGESEATFKETIEFFKRRATRGNIVIISTNVATYYPGSLMTRRALDKGLPLDFSQPTPNRSFPWNRFEDGQGHHPPNVTIEFVSQIVAETTSKLSPFLLKGNIHARYDQCFTDLDGASLINLNHADELQGSLGSRYVSSTAPTSAERIDAVESVRSSIAALVGLARREVDERVVLGRTVPEAIALGLSIADLFDAGKPVQALLIDPELSTMRPFQFRCDHGNTFGKNQSRPYVPSIFESNGAGRWQATQPTGWDIDVLYSSGSDEGLISNILQRLTEGPSVVLLPHVYPDTGDPLDLPFICRELRAEKQHIVLLIDGRHTLGLSADHTPQDSLDYDFYILSAATDFGVPCVSAAVLGPRHRGALARWHSERWDGPLLEGMVAAAVNRPSNAEHPLPHSLIMPLTAMLGAETVSGDIHDLAQRVRQHNREIRAHLDTLLETQHEFKATCAQSAQATDSFAAYRFPGLDHYALVEALWREAHILTAYFCRRDLVRFSFDLGTTPHDIERVVAEIATLRGLESRLALERLQ